MEETIKDGAPEEVVQFQRAIQSMFMDFNEAFGNNMINQQAFGNINENALEKAPPKVEIKEVEVESGSWGNHPLLILICVLVGAILSWAYLKRKYHMIASQKDNEGYEILQDVKTIASKVID